MDTLFWTGIGIGFVLSVVASIIANLYSERLQRWLESRRKARTLRALSYEKRIYRLVKKLRSEPAFAIVYAMRAVGLLTLLIGGGTWMLLLVVVNRLTQTDDTSSRIMSWPLHPTTDRYYVLILASFVFFFCAWAAVGLLRRFGLLYESINDFSRYRNKLLAKWPNENWAE